MGSCHIYKYVTMNYISEKPSPNLNYIISLSYILRHYTSQHASLGYRHMYILQFAKKFRILFWVKKSKPALRGV